MDTSKPLIVEDLIDDRFYRASDLQRILKKLGASYSIYTIRDYENWKCKNYKCAKKFPENVGKCTNCGAELRPPIIHSPRSRGGAKGFGHRRYTGAEIKEIVKIFTARY